MILVVLLSAGALITGHFDSGEHSAGVLERTVFSNSSSKSGSNPKVIPKVGVDSLKCLSRNITDLLC